MPDFAIQVENLGKRYRIGNRAPYARFTELLTGMATLPCRMLNRIKTADAAPASATEDFWALKDINFTIKQGDIVGIIGRNGAGKSTLLKLLSRITHPTTGTIAYQGRIGSLLEVGTGFHPELSGRDNIYLNGAILGMTRSEIKAKFDEIVEFAEVEKFLDTAVKHYSSGMYMRLAFAVAAHLEPEILLVDEVLAVGDAEFQKKCLGKMSNVAKSGRTILFVSHNMSAIKSLCNKTALFQSGKLVNYDNTPTILNEYANQLTYDSPTFPITANQEITINDFCTTQNGNRTTEINLADPFEIKIDFILLSDVSNFRIGTYICNAWGTISRTFHTDWDCSLETMTSGNYTASVKIPKKVLVPGNYSLILHASRYGQIDYFKQKITQAITIYPSPEYNSRHPEEPIDSVILIANPWDISRI